MRKTKGYSTQVLSWVQAISAYNLTGDEKWKRFATSTADRYIDLQIYKNSSQPVGLMSFYNTNVYAPWWDLIDLYELTKEEKYLKAAQYGASNTIAGIRSFPTVTEDLQTIHPETVLMGIQTCGGKEKRNIVWDSPAWRTMRKRSKCRNGLFHRSD